MLTPLHTRCEGPRRRREHALLGLLGGLSAFGCGSDADLPKQYLGDSSETSGLEPSGGGGSQPMDSAWSCLGMAPPALPQPRANWVVGFALPVEEWTTQAPLAGRGLTATLCSSIDFRCAQPLGAPYMVQDRMLGNIPLPVWAAGVPVLEGFDGFIKFDVTAADDAAESQRFIPVDYFLSGSVSGDMSQGAPILMLQRGSQDIVFQQSLPSFNSALAAQTGTVLVTVADCTGFPVSDVRVEIVVAGVALDGITRFLLPTSRIPIEIPAGQPLFTGASAVVGFLGVPPGAVQLRAFRRGDAQPFGTREVGAVPGEISVGVLRPAFLNSANFTGGMPFCTGYACP